MNELITSHQSGWNGSKAVTIQHLARLHSGTAGAVIYLGHGETLANADVFVVWRQNKMQRELGVWVGVTEWGAVVPYN